MDDDPLVIMMHVPFLLKLMNNFTLYYIFIVANLLLGIINLSIDKILPDRKEKILF